MAARKHETSMDDSNFRNMIGAWPDFPKKGVVFRDINPLLLSSDGLASIINRLCQLLEFTEIDLVAGIEARGFVIASAVAMKLNKGLVLIRKAGKLPGPTISEPYNIEYGSATMEVQRNSVKADQKVVIVDDVIATGGTAIAATNLLERLGGIISGCAFVINLKNLRGAEKLCTNGFRVHYILEYE